MATFNQIKAVRLIINDPPEYIDIIQVDNLAALPVAPALQTAYNLADTGSYMYHDGTNYVTIGDLQISDTRIGGWIDSFSESGSVVRCFQAIIAKLGARLQMVKNSDGAESTEYTSIDKLLAYYRQVSSDYLNIVASEVKKNTGRWGKAQAIEISGGLI